MTPQEQQLLDSLVERVNQTQLQEKDPDAEALLNRSLGGNADALYILAQTILVQNIALDQARAQVTQLQQQVQQARQQPAHATSFLGNLLGHRDPDPPPYTPVPQPVYTQGVQPQYQPPQYQQPQYAPVLSGPPSFLRGAMQTAAGVAAGALAFEGVESVLHGMGGFGGPGLGWGGMGPGLGMMGGGFGRPVEETVVNNYYDQPGGQGTTEHGGFEHGSLDQGGGEQHFHESADQNQDRSQDGARFFDASSDTSGNDQGSYDDANADDSASLDNSSFDNSGFDNSGMDGGSGFDDGGGFGGDGGGDLL